MCIYIYLYIESLYFLIYRIYNMCIIYVYINILIYIFKDIYIKCVYTIFIYIQDCLRKLEYCDEVLYFL